MIYRLIIPLFTLLSLLLSPAVGFARPDMTPLGPNIADKGSAWYRFTVNTFDSADGQRHYKVWTAVPRKPAPAAGYAALYMLDGNAVMNHLSEALLQKLAAGNPPVLVAVGYQTPLPFDLAARTLDYTPPQQVQDRRGRPAGGSAAFRQLLEQTIAPRAERNLPINAQQRALWGHSYGGLFVLDSYLTSGFFQRYFAASPSLRGDATLLQQMAAVTPASFKQKQLVLMEGNGEFRSGVSDVLSRIRTTLDGMQENGLAARFQLFPGLSHGQMFPASLESALSAMAEDGAPSRAPDE